MRRLLTASAFAHGVLLVLLYLEDAGREIAGHALEERAARQRYDVLANAARRWRELERRERESERALDAGAALVRDGAARAGAGSASPGHAGSAGRGLGVAPGTRVWRGRTDWGFAGWAQGPAAPRSREEQRVLADPALDQMTPGRVFLGQARAAAWAFVDSWYTIGPFPEGKERWPPELQVDLDARYAGASGASLRWLFHQSPRPEIVPRTMQPYSVHYAYTQLRSDRARQVWLALGADDAMKVWLNGELVWDCGEHWRPWALDEGARQVTLRPGYNSLLVRLDNSPDHGAFSVAVRP